MSVDHLGELETHGWTIFDADARVQDWVDFAQSEARATMDDPAFRDWWRAGDTWFVGVNALGNDSAGRLPGGPDLAGAAFDFINSHAGQIAWDAAQVSVIRPGYPVQDRESDAAFRFRLNRDAAHLDGLKRAGPENRRFIGEYHRFLLGIPMVESDERASPLVVWNGSHHILQDMLANALAGVHVDDWASVDFTQIYHQTRRQIFETCERVVVHAKPGQVYLVHRHALHGISPWQDHAVADPVGRMIVYFRPETPDRQAWLSDAGVI